MRHRWKQSGAGENNEGRADNDKDGKGPKARSKKQIKNPRENEP